MKINSQASRDKIRAHYGSVREFARQCVDAFGVANVQTAYVIIDRVLVVGRGASDKRASIARDIRLHLEREDLLVFDDEGRKLPV